MATVLVIEDNAKDFQTIQRMLDFATHQVVRYVDAASAIQALENGSVAPDAILANLIMHNLDGFLLCRKLKQSETHAHIPVLLLAPIDAETGDEKLAKRAGAMGLLRKPLQRDLLLSELDRAAIMASVQEPIKQSETEELAYLRDYNAWLSRMLSRMHRTSSILQESAALNEAHINAINKVTTALGRNLDIHDTAETLVQKSAELTRAHAVAVYDRLEDTVFQLRHVAGMGIPTPRVSPDHVMDEDSPFLPIGSMEQVLLFTQPDELARLKHSLDLSVMPTSAIVSPLVARRMLTGILVALRVDEDDPFTGNDAEMMYSLAGAAGLAVRSAHLFSNLEQAYNDLQEMDRRKSEFVAITSHELRTPIAIMLGYASLLHDEEQDEMKKGQLSIIEKQASFLSGMVDMLINLHELSDNTAQIALRCMPVELPTLLKSALDFTKNHSTSKRKVDVTIDSGDFSIKGDEVRLMLALSNLIDNAIKFSNDGDTVEITVAESPFSGVVITIEDHGIGIPGEELENIFEPFYQVESSLTRRYGGMGLGLAIVRGIVELHGGKLDIRSQVEIGTRVIVSLPDAPPEDRCMDF